MPLPKPKSKEERKDFSGRCMGDSEMNKKFPNQSQRFAVCRSIWEKKIVDKLTKSLDKK